MNVVKEVQNREKGAKTVVRVDVGIDWTRYDTEGTEKGARIAVRVDVRIDRTRSVITT